MSAIVTTEDFAQLVKEIESTPGYRQPIGFGICRVDRGQLNKDKILSCDFPVMNWGKNMGSAAVFQKAAGLTDQVYEGPEIVTSINGDFLCAALECFAPYAAEAKGNAHRNVQVLQTLKRLSDDKSIDLQDYRLVMLYKDAEPQSLPASYLKLLALSTGAAPLRSLNLKDIFGTLENVAWVDGKPFELDYLRANEIEMRLTGTYPAIQYVDKFPQYLRHIIPQDNVRILDTSRVRFGAHLGAGTTVMPGASYINFNAGTLGAVMVEGRISSSVVVGAETDVGGGASIIGVLSGPNKTPITIGQKCFLGANSVTGISLGDGCIVDASIAVLPGTRVFIEYTAIAALNAVNPGVQLESKAAKVVDDGKLYEFKAAALAGCSGLHFRVDGRSGRTIAFRSTKAIELNPDLH